MAFTESGGSNNSANAAMASEVDNIWSVFEPTDLYDNDVSPADSVESLFDVSWDHIPGYVSDTSSSDTPDSMPDLQTVSDSSASIASSMPSLHAVSLSMGSSVGEWDWLSEVGDAAPSDDLGLQFAETDLASAMADINPGNEDLVAAMLTDVVKSPGHIDLYDLGSTQHLSPYHDQFLTYEDIPAKSFTAVNKQQFNAVGSGEMVIDVPDGMDISKMKLTEVLYSPEVRYTLISIGHLDKAGFSATFGQGQCEIHSSDGEQMGTIPKSMKGLYHIIHESAKPESGDSANAATTHLTAMEFHHQMGHVSPVVAECLVTQGFVTGVSLNTSADEPTLCKSCVYAKSCRQTIPKV